MKQFTNKLIVLVGVQALCLSLLWVKEGQAAGTSTAQFLKLGSGARAAAMGNAFSSISDDVTATYWNPAGLNQIKHTEISLMQNNWLMGATYQNASAAVAKENYAVGVSLYRMDYGSFDGYDNSNAKTASFDAGSMATSFTLATKLNSNMNFGLNGKYIQETIESKKASTFASDFGLLINKGKYNLGFVIQNLGTGLKFIDKKESLPLTFRGGVSSKFFEEQLLVGFDLSKSNDNDLTYHSGVEYRVNDRVFMRGGYEMTPSNKLDVNGLTGISAGLGLNFGLLNVDYALTPFGDLGNTHKISLLIRFN